LIQYPEGMGFRSAPRTSLGKLFSRNSAAEAAPAPIRRVPQLRYFNHGILANQVYWTGCYLPAAAGIWFARALHMPVLSMLYAVRLMGLLCFLAAVACAFRLAPDFRALIVAVALMPMTMEQAVAVSADSLTISFAFAGFALILYARGNAVGPRYLACLSVFMPLWVLCKGSVWLCHSCC